MTPEQQLIQQIIQVIDSNQLEQKNLLMEYADQFAEMCRLANERLVRCNDYLDKGMRSEAVYEAHMQPDLLQLSVLVNQDSMKKWHNICLDLELTPYQPLNQQIVERLRREGTQEADLAPLLKEYRRCVYQSDHASCIRILREIREKDPDNPTWKTNLEPLEAATIAAWQEQAEAALRTMDLVRLKTIFNELNHPYRVVKPDDGLMKRLRVALMSERSEDLRLEGEKLQGKLLAAIKSEEPEEIEAMLRKCGHLEEDEAFLKRPEGWSEKQSEARELLETLGRRKAKQADFNKAVSALRDMLEGGKASEMELRHEWERVEAWDMPVPELLRKQVEETLAAKRGSRLRKARMIVYGVAVAIVVAVVVVCAVVYVKAKNHHRGSSLAEMQNMFDTNRIEELEKRMEQVGEQDPVFFKSPGVQALYDKVRANREKYNQMQAVYKAQREELESIRKGGYRAEKERVERILREAEENATSAQDTSWLKSWRSGWEGWERRQTSDADKMLELAVRQIDTSLLSMRNLGFEAERQKLEEMREVWMNAQAEEAHATDDIRKLFVEAKEKLDARLLDLDKREGDAKAAMAEAEKAKQEKANKLTALRRDIPRALPDFTRYKLLLQEFVEIGKDEPEYHGYQSALGQMDMYAKACLLSRFSLQSLAVGGEGQKKVMELLKGDVVADDSVWKQDIREVEELMTATIMLRRKVMSLLNANKNDLQIYLMKYRRKGEETWKTLYSQEPLLEKTQDGITTYWGMVYWVDAEDDKPVLLHTGKIFVDEKLTTEHFEFERRRKKDDNLAPHTRFLRKLLGEANEAEHLDVHLLRGLQALRADDEIDTIPSAWLAKRMIYFLHENCAGEIPETVSWIEIVKNVDTDVPWLNRKHPKTKEAVEKITEMWMKLPDFTPVIKRLEMNRQLLCAGLSAGVQCVGMLARDEHGALQFVSCARAGSELWILQSTAGTALPSFKLLSEDGRTLMPEVLQQDCFAGIPVFAPARGHESRDSLVRLNIAREMKDKVVMPHAWPVNAY